MAISLYCCFRRRNLIGERQSNKTYIRRLGKKKEREKVVLDIRRSTKEGKKERL